jgi:tetratricopeptide (TPR) repeat protein
MGRHDAAEPFHSRALRILRKVYDGEHPDIASVMNDMVRTVLPRDPAVAESLCREALAMRRRLLDKDHADVAWSLYNLAYVLIERGNLDDAEAILDETLAKRGSSLPDQHPIVSSCLLLRGRIEMARGEYRRALEEFNECLDLRSRTLPPDHWLIAAAESYLGDCLVHLGAKTEGGKLLSDSYCFLRAKLGADHEVTRHAAARMSS